MFHFAQNFCRHLELLYPVASRALARATRSARAIDHSVVMFIEMTRQPLSLLPPVYRPWNYTHQ